MATNYYKNGRYKYNSGDSHPMKWASQEWITITTLYPSKCVFCGSKIWKGDTAGSAKNRFAHPLCLSNWQDTVQLKRRSA